MSDDASRQLTPAQRAALEHVERYARSRRDAALRNLDEVLQMADIAREDFAEAVAHIKAHARVALHFHPDRPDARLQTVAESLLACGVYKSQFETQLSSGSVTAFAGGSRDRWERQIFGGAYHQDGITNAQRPKYGALDLRLHGDGPAPRFGSSYFLLGPAASSRCTFTYLDSHRDPPEKGTLAELDDILAALYTEAFVRDFAVGEKALTPTRLTAHLRAALRPPFPDPARRPLGHNLDHYIEAQVHGSISLAEDVEVLVADPAFRDTATGRVLTQLCQQYRIELHWHPGYEMAVEDVPSNFRGPTMPSLARRVAGQGRLDVARIGAAALELKHNPAAWSDRGTYAEVLQELKLLWHVLVKFGKPRQRVSP